MDINRALRTAAQTGKVQIGLRETERAVSGGKAKLVVIASNVPAKAKAALQELARKKGVPLYEFQGPNSELGPACGKPFSIASLSVLEAGESDILALARSPG